MSHLPGRAGPSRWWRGVAHEQEPVARLHLVGKSHERQRVTAEGECHPPTDNLWRLFHVVDGGTGVTPVGSWTPEVHAHEVPGNPCSGHSALPSAPVCPPRGHRLPSLPSPPLLGVLGPGPAGRGGTQFVLFISLIFHPAP